MLYLAKKEVSPYEFYKKSGVTRGILQQNNGISEENIARFLAYAPDVNTEWLLTGNGSMLKKPTNGISSELVKTDPTKGENYIPPTAPMEQYSQKEAIPLTEIKETSKIKPIPLVTETVAAGFGNEHFSITEKDVKEYYVIPKFRFCRVDFMIEVSGLSMYPHFNPGDVIACTILNDRKFIQWNKCHVIATREQGILVKRLMPSNNKDSLTAVSDNKDYLPFDIPIEDITGLALVVGSVSLE
ncbi:LexA family transcriptional regulator [Prevotella sp. PMUR]|uniref:LexA family transcriptional regulator n=1 Tax=Xylanibacter muris TaxID=2736290 RepID=A0ABX2AKU8_9BACT|nr:LexA family transcriptional regulator [Xylanibacter muris]